MPVGLDVFVVTVSLARQVLASLFLVILVAGGIFFLTFQKSMTKKSYENKDHLLFWEVSLSLSLRFFFWQNVSIEVCLIALYHFLFSIFFTEVFLLRSESASSNLCMRSIKVHFNQGWYLKIFLLHSILLYTS